MSDVIKKILTLSMVLFLLPMSFAELDICDIDLDFESTKNWLTIEYEEEGVYKVEVYNTSNTSQLIGTARLEIDDCPVIPLCGEELNLEANSTHTIDTEYCDIEINTKGVRTELFNEVVSDRNKKQDSLDECIKRNFSVSIPEDSCICEVDCALEKEEENTGNNNEEGFMESNKTLFIILGVLVLFLILIVVVVIVVKKKPEKDERYPGERYHKPQNVESTEVELPRRDIPPTERFQEPHEESKTRGPDFSFFKRDRK